MQPISRKHEVKHGESVAQQVEHIPFKDGVLGSSPSWFTEEKNGRSSLFYILHVAQTKIKSYLCRVLFFYIAIIMPYRRLPNTDQARLHALQNAVRRASEADFTEQVLTYKTLNEAQRFLLLFENQVSQYHQNFQSKVSANKKYRHIVGNARMYISHFIQVLNMTVIRGEIKKEQKELYKLDIDTHILPDLSSEEDLLVWGQNIIEGEAERIKQGGFPLYNPSISKVQVHYDIFKEKQVMQKMHKKTANKTYEDLEGLRKQADELILDIWNQVEAYYAQKLPYERLRCCQNYGLIYYYRTGEKRLTAESDKEIVRQKAQTPTIDFA